MSNTIIQVAHDRPSNTLELRWRDDSGSIFCRNFHPLQIDDFKEIGGEVVQGYIDLAGWTPEYIASVKKKEEDEATEKQAIADAEEAERKSKREKAEKEAFDADVARQVAVLEAAKKIVDSKK